MDVQYGKPRLLVYCSPMDSAATTGPVRVGTLLNSGRVTGDYIPAYGPYRLTVAAVKADAALRARVKTTVERFRKEVLRGRNVRSMRTSTCADTQAVREFSIRWMVANGELAAA